MSDFNSNFNPDSNQSSSTTHYGTPSKKKRNESHGMFISRIVFINFVDILLISLLLGSDTADARFQSPLHKTSVMCGTNTANLSALGSPEINNFMSVFMSPMSAQYHPHVPDSK